MSPLSRFFKIRNLLWLAPLPLLWFSLRNIPLKEVWASLGSLNPQAIFALAGLNAAILVLFASRWWLILRYLGYSRPYLSLVSYRLAAFGVSYFTPGPQLGGEPLQAYLVHRQQEVPSPVAIASVSLDKLLELLANFTFLIVGLTTVTALGLGGWQLTQGTMLGLAGLLALPLVYFLALLAGWTPLTWLAKRLPLTQNQTTRLSKATQTIASAEQHMAEFCKIHPGVVLSALSLSFFTWAVLIFEYWLALGFLGLSMDLPSILTVMTAARIAFLLPMPGGLGTLEAGQVLAMEALGFDPTIGISISLLIRGRDMILGVVGLWLGGILTQRAIAQPAPTQL